MKTTAKNEYPFIFNDGKGCFIMRGINKVTILGTLGRDPEVRYTQNGNAIANINVATSDQWTDKQSGQKQEKTEWHRIVIYGKLAEIAGQYLKKGSVAYFEGKLQTRKWQNQQGQDQYTTEIIIDAQGTMQMIGGNKDNRSGGAPAASQSSAPAQSFAQDDGPVFTPSDDDYF